MDEGAGDDALDEEAALAYVRGALEAFEEVRESTAWPCV
jgi:hypothetical protein